MEEKKVARLSIIRNIIIVAFVVILAKALYMTTIKYEHYIELAENKTFKQLPIKAPRGEIRDKYGKLIAGNENIFTIQVSADQISKKDSNNKSMANDISLKLINLLEKNNEEYIDEFPIKIKNGKYYYTFDEEIKKFKVEYDNGEGIPQNLNAKESFYYIVDKEINKGTLTKEDRKLEPVKLQQKLNENGIYPPILVSSMMFTEEKNKRDWLESYWIEDLNISAEKAFKEIRNGKPYEIDKSINDLDARKILVVRDLIKSQGYSKYNPVTIAKDISENTIAQIEENGMKLPGVSVASEPVRYYPEENLASHTIGHLGKMPSSEEKYYLKEKDGKKYSKGDTIGMSGIEKNYEEQLKGIDGYRKVQVDALGNVTKELDVSEPISGDTVYLSLDIELQKKTEDALKRLLKAAQNGSTFESKLGNKSLPAAPNAKSGAVIAIDPKTGDVLSMASFPDYDPNKFVNGISSEDYKALQPKNKNDVLAPNAQVNLVTQGVFQPGSTYKTVTGMAAIDNGLSPKFAINDPGVYYLSSGGRPFADLIWHQSRRTHGYTNLYKALQESCNIYFYTISTGKNWAGGNSPNVKIGVNDVLEYGKKFGLDQYSGLDKEVGERKGKYPSIESKGESAKALLRNFIYSEMENTFTDISKQKDEKAYDARIEKIVAWADEEKTIGRTEAINRLTELNVKEDKVEYFADKIVFDHLNFSKWTTADTFNIAIGQGENQYTPAQVVRMTAAIANGGDLVELSVVDRVISSNYASIFIDENEREKIDFNDSENLKHITQGMKQVSSQGSAKGVFANFPVEVATKTGTAEKSGKIPTPNEVQYLESHMGSYGVSLQEARNLAAKLKKEREQELSKEREKEIKEQLKSDDLDEEEKAELEEELKDGVKVELEDTDKINAAYLRKAIKELNKSITDDRIDAFKSNYQAFSWGIGFAPADDPEIAVVTMIPQGETSTYAMLLMREVMGSYFGFTDESEENKKNEDIENSNLDNSQINFSSQMKK